MSASLIMWPLILSTLMLSTHIMQSECRHNDKRRQKEKTAASTNYLLNDNICDITDRESKVHCYCENIQLKNATKADCWVFNGGITKDDSIWPSFTSQPNLGMLSFNVRADGGLNFVPTNAIKYLRRLRTINIKYASIGILKTHAFANLTSLSEIILTRNKIVVLERFSFAHLPNITSISLDENRISELNREVFYDLPLLQKLYLTNNNISVLHDGCFKHLVNLVELEMDTNYISILTRESFQGLANLKRLDLRNNSLNMLGHFTFAELWNLQELSLDNNDLKYISGRAFDGLSQLKRLSLSENKLKILTEGLFEGVRGLMLLDLRSNELQSLTFDNIKPIIDNLKTAPSALFLEGNNFACDCRLSWIHVLRNETKSEQLRAALEQVTCIVDSVLSKRLGNKFAEASTQKINIYYHSKSDSSFDTNNVFDLKNGFLNKDDDDLDVVDNDSSEIIYDEPIYDDTQQDSAHNGDETTLRAKVDDQKNLFQIPFELLPCPQELINRTDSSFAPPTQDEVRYYYRNAALNCGASLALSTSILLLHLKL